ncbi:hypothetical protein PR048_018464 [Dryococelus australis]|uniref:Uncharacterized protein n=1 Tax=Dryococelus australis TaxID=614101 RepID=A0ABQ9HCR1_9NEOP|nr:hypothetical protein PR048_018464 [Dryococelus australis]
MGVRAASGNSSPTKRGNSKVSGPALECIKKLRFGWKISINFNESNASADFILSKEKSVLGSGAEVQCVVFGIRGVNKLGVGRKKGGQRVRDGQYLVIVDLPSVTSGAARSIRTELGGAVVTYRTRVREDTGSIPGPAILIPVFHGFPKSLRANVGMGPKTKAMADSFPIPLPCATCAPSSDLAVGETLSLVAYVFSCTVLKHLPNRPCVGAGIKGQGKREYPEKTRCRASSSSTIPTRENSGVNVSGIEPGSSWWEASALATTPPLSRWTIINPTVIFINIAATNVDRFVLSWSGAILCWEQLCFYLKAPAYLTLKLLAACLKHTFAHETTKHVSRCGDLRKERTLQTKPAK